MNFGYEYQAVDHNASVRAEVQHPYQVKIIITHGEDEPTSITMWAEDFDNMVREIARPATPTYPPTPTATGGILPGFSPQEAPPSGLGDSIRRLSDVAVDAGVMIGTRLNTCAARADALERERDEAEKELREASRVIVRVLALADEYASGRGAPTAKRIRAALDGGTQ